MPDQSRPLLTDRYRRDISYMRLSVTDRCNLRCRYCRVDDTFIPHPDVLRYEEMERLVRLAAGLGIQKVRLTGGEPFVRKGFPDFLARLREAHPDLDLRMTTNGVLLAPHAPLLADLGVKVNLSLDSLRPDRFKAVTGRALLPKVLDAIDAMSASGVRFKINAVAMKGFNDAELPAFLRLASGRSIDVRFIEFMPMGTSTIWDDARFWSADDILREASQLAELVEVRDRGAQDGPARMFDIDGGPGRLGLITAMSNHFCAACNRLRVTSDGHLRTCLFDDTEYNLTPVLRHPKLNDEHLVRILRRAILRKPVGSELLARRRHNAVTNRAMTAIGG